jgi:anaerobic ribonucleoside-triphosphate reductase
MALTNYDHETKWCEHCKVYVRYLMSVDHSFCVKCGNRVRLFNRDDGRRFTETVQRHKWRAS